jgi:hypothetical protein
MVFLFAWSRDVLTVFPFHADYNIYLDLLKESAIDEFVLRHCARTRTRMHEWYVCMDAHIDACIPYDACMMYAFALLLRMCAPDEGMHICMRVIRCVCMYACIHDFMKGRLKKNL